MSIFTKTSGMLAASCLALISGTAMAGDRAAPTLPSLIPANPVAGECYARVKIPARYETRTKSVLVEDGYTGYNVTQPQISRRTQDVMVKEASVEYRVRQPRYTTVTEQMLVRPAYEKLTVSPPSFKHVTETINVTSPRLVWKKGNPRTLASQGYIIHSTADAGPGGRGYRSTAEFGLPKDPSEQCGATCEIWCLVEEPGQSVSYNRKVLASPGSVNRVPVPAKYQTIMKQVVADPGGVEEIPIPAQYKSVTVEDVHPGSASLSLHMDDVYSDVAVKVPMEAERYEWRRVVCDPGTHPGTARRSSSSHNSSHSSHHMSGSHNSSSIVSGSHSSSSYGSSSHSSGHSSGATSSATGSYIVGGQSQGYSNGSSTYGTVPPGGTYGHDTLGSSHEDTKREKPRYRR